MTESLLLFGTSNLCVSLVLALVAWTVQTTLRRPVLAHLLWVLVLVKLVTPPLVSVPLVELPGPRASAEVASHGDAVPAVSGEVVLPGTIESVAHPEWIATLDEGASAFALTPEQGRWGLVLLWLLGSFAVFGGSVIRIVRFHRLLKLASTEAPAEIQRMAKELARELGLATTPTIVTTTAHLSPLVWWVGGPVRVVIPASLPQELDNRQLRWVLAHELAHVQRRDHMVRWLEWLACVAFWWNPVAWWARRNLRASEEICCDALVLSRISGSPQAYAHSLLNVVEYLASPVLRPPAMASEINSGGFLERRFRMIVSPDRVRPTPRWVQASLLVLALGLLPLGVAYSQDADDRITGAFAKLGVDEEGLEKIENHLAEKGFSDEQIEKSLGALIRIAMGMQSKDTPFEMNERLEIYLVDKLGLDEEQIEALIGVAKKVAYGAQKKESPIAVYLKKVQPRLMPVLEENGFDEEQIELVFKALHRLVPQMKTEEPELDPKMEDWLIDEVGLDEEQIDIVLRIAQRLAHGFEKQKTAGVPAQIEKMRPRLTSVLVEKGGLDDEQIEQVIAAMPRIVTAMMAEKKFPLERVEAHLANEFGLDEEQIELVLGLSKRVAKSLAKNPMAEAMKRFRPRLLHAFEENGLDEEQVMQVFEILPKLAGTIAKTDGEFELSPEWENHFANEVGLTGAQLDLVVGVAHRIAAAVLETRREEQSDLGPTMRRMVPVLKERGGLEDEQIRPTIGALHRIVPQMKAQGENYELDPKLEDYLVDEVGLSDEQIELVLGIAKRLSLAEKKKSGKSGRF